jgi:flagellum-specific ATP synthase
MTDVTDPEIGEAARRLRALIAAREDNRDLVMMGAYRAGTDKVLDTALAHSGQIDGFLQQPRGESVSLAESYSQLAALSAGLGASS